MMKTERVWNICLASYSNKIYVINLHWKHLKHLKVQTNSEARFSNSIENSELQVSKLPNKLFIIKMVFDIDKQINKVL